MKIDILAVGVHPDDIELGCSGTLLKQASLGYTFGLIDFTLGELGSRGSAELRLEEASNASKILGAAFRENLKMEDGFFEINKTNILKVAKAIRTYCPDVVFANAIMDRHPDHGRASKLLSDACFYSGLLKIELTDDDGKPLEPWRPKAIYHYIQDRNIKPDFCVDISPFMGKKMEAIMAFSSQFKADKNDGPQTPISSQLFYEFLFAKARSYGRDINADFAEGFTVERTIGVEDVMKLT